MIQDDGAGRRSERNFSGDLQSYMVPVKGICVLQVGLQMQSITMIGEVNRMGSHLIKGLF